MRKDIIETASNKEFNKDLLYMVAWRALNGNVLRQAKADKLYGLSAVNLRNQVNGSYQESLSFCL